jgi:hypothetical protein
MATSTTSPNAAASSAVPALQPIETIVLPRLSGPRELLIVTALVRKWG